MDTSVWVIWGIAALAVGYLLARWFAGRNAKPRITLDQALREPEHRAAGMTLLKERLKSALRQADPAPALQGVASYATTLLEIGEPRLAAEILAEIPLDKLPPEIAVIAVNNHAIAHLDVDDVTGARAALARMKEAPPGDAADVLASTDALVTALEGHHAEALALCEALEARAVDADITLTVAEARATALAGVGKTEEAREVLAAPGRTYILEQIVRRGGPAAPVAQQLIDEMT